MERETRLARWLLRRLWLPYSNAAPEWRPGATAKWAVSVVPFDTLMLLMVIPEPAFTCVAPLKVVFCPTIVTNAAFPVDELAGDAQATTGMFAGNNRLNPLRIMKTAIWPRVTGSSGQ